MRKGWAWTSILFASVLAFSGSTTVGLTPVSAAGLQAADTAQAVPPNPVGGMDCNGRSTKYQEVKQDLGGLCTDVAGYWDGSAYRFVDNGSYIGHDEPSVKFISNEPGSGYSMTYSMRLSTDPTKQPTISPTGKTVTDYAELSPAPWFGLPICDPGSYPQNPCTPDSDSNSGEINNPNDAGSAFMELQFYPPGYTPFVDSPSCSQTQWCAAINIDSLEAQFGFANLNLSCEEPVNFAFLQTNGVPAGPPSPQLQDTSTFTPNSATLLMNPGDSVVVTVNDTPAGLFTGIVDQTTHQSGFMVASAGNGFMNTNYQTCAGTPFSFHPEYNTASPQNQVPWAALEGGVLMEQEIGHFEPCASLTNTFPYVAYGGTFVDSTTAQTCVGGFEGAGNSGEGPCAPSTGICQNADTQNGAPCPSDNFNSGQLCEFSDMTCVPAGSRTVEVNGVPTLYSWPIAGCQDNYFQNGDLDYDGSSYIADWPDGSPDHPTSFEYSGPISNGKPYPQIQFETDAAGSEALCDVSTGTGCTVPPAGAQFYPFWTLARNGHSSCVWNFGNDIPGDTFNDFGQDAQYGVPDIARFGGTLTSPVISNPQLGVCHK
jgi:hypothetical protein